MKKASVDGLDGRPVHWWQRIEWIDVVLIAIVLLIILILTSEIWLPHYGPE